MLELTRTRLRGTQVTAVESTRATLDIQRTTPSEPLAAAVIIYLTHLAECLAVSQLRGGFFRLALSLSCPRCFALRAYQHRILGTAMIRLARWRNLANASGGFPLGSVHCGFNPTWIYTTFRSDPNGARPAAWTPAASNAFCIGAACNGGVSTSFTPSVRPTGVSPTAPGSSSRVAERRSTRR